MFPMAGRALSCSSLQKRSRFEEKRLPYALNSTERLELDQDNKVGTKFEETSPTTLKKWNKTSLIGGEENLV